MQKTRGCAPQVTAARPFFADAAVPELDFASKFVALEARLAGLEGVRLTPHPRSNIVIQMPAVPTSGAHAKLKGEHAKLKREHGELKARMASYEQSEPSPSSQRACARSRANC